MLPQCLRCRVAEGFLSLLVEDNNAEPVVERDDGLTRQIEHSFQALTCDLAFFLDPLSAGDITSDYHEPGDGGAAVADRCTGRRYPSGVAVGQDHALDAIDV